MNYAKFESVTLRGDAGYNERWVQERLAEDPSLLGLGDVVLKDKERTQPRAGRLDLLFQAADTSRRYEVEVQLGATDEAHIVRTLEYWDIERKRYPQYEHTAVIVAEDITSRFLNVISLFNGHIPLIAIQMRALRIGDAVGLVFTKVLDQLSLGAVDEDEDTYEVADRAYWENRGSHKTIMMADSLLELVRSHDVSFELKYNKFYIGLARNGIADNFVIFRPMKSFLRFEPHLERSEELQEKLEKAGLDVMDYDERFYRYRIRLTPEDLSKHRDVIKEVMGAAFLESRRG